jgi:hypothetical protein
MPHQILKRVGEAKLHMSIQVFALGMLLLSGCVDRTRPTLDESVHAEDVEWIEIVVSYDEPIRYRVTAPMPVSEIVAGLREPSQPYVPEESPVMGPACKLVLVAKNREFEVPLGVGGGLLAVSVGETPLQPSTRLKRILDIIMLRLAGAPDPPTSDEDLPGGFHVGEIQFPDRHGDTDFVLAILNAVVEGYVDAYEHKTFRFTDMQKMDCLWALTWRLKYVDAIKEIDRIAEEYYRVIELTKTDKSVSPEFGGIPYGIRVQLSLRDTLGKLYEEAKMHDRAVREYEKLDSLLTPALISMATNEPADLPPPAVSNKESLQTYLKWLKNTDLPESIERCKEKLASNAEVMAEPEL